MRHDYVLEASATVPFVVYNLQGAASIAVYRAI